MSSITSALFTFAELLVAAGGAAVAAVALGSFFGRKWLEHQISKALEAFKHGQLKELEAHKTVLQNDLSRRTRISQTEHELLSDLWRRLIDSAGKTNAASIRFRSHADLSRLSETELEQWLDERKIEGSNKDFIMKSGVSERNRAYGRADDARLGYEAMIACRDTKDALQAASVTIDQGIYLAFCTLLEQIRNAAWQADYEARYERLPTQERNYLFLEKGEEAIGEIRPHIAAFLRDGTPFPADFHFAAFEKKKGG